MNFETITLEVSEGVATLTINRPEAANALNRTMAAELLEAAVFCGTSDAVRAVVITAHGRFFCAGGDISEFQEAGEGAEAMLYRMAGDLHAALIRFARIDAPVIMAVNGTAAGGGLSMMLSGDYVIAAEEAKFVSAYTKSALTPDGSSTFFLAKHVGLLRAKELMLTNRVLTAAEALDWGMVSKVVPAAEVHETARAMAVELARGPTRALGGVKSMLLSAFGASIEHQLEQETRNIASMMASEDGREGIAAFLEKRSPEYQGR